MNSLLKGACSWFVERGLKVESMLRVAHQYPKDIIVVLQKNQQQLAFYHDHYYDRENYEFDVQEISTPYQYHLHLDSYNIELKE